MTYTTAEPHPEFPSPAELLDGNRRVAESFASLVAEPLVLIRTRDDENPCVIRSVN